MAGVLRALLRAIATFFASIAWLLLGAVLLVASFAYHSNLPVARRVARDLINQVASGPIRGALLVNRFDQLDSERIVARHVMLFDGDGRRVVVADKLVLVPAPGSLSALFYDRSQVRFTHAELEGGVVRLADENGMPSLFTAFDAPAGTKKAGGSGLRVLIDDIALHDVTLYGDLLGVDNLRARNITAHGQLALGADGNVEITIRDARGELTEPFGFIGGVDQLAGTISTLPERGVVLDAKLHRDTEHATVHVEHHVPRANAAPELDLRVNAQGLSTNTLTHLGYGWAEPLSGSLVGQLHLHGPLDTLALEADVTSEAGHVRVGGAISDERGVALRITSDNLAVSKLLASAPNVSVRGALDLSVPHAGADPQLHLALDALRYKGIAVPAVEVEGVIESDRFRIKRARTSARGAKLMAKGSLGWDGSADLDLDAYFPAVERDPNLSRLVQNVRGALTAKLHLVTPRDSRGFLNLDGRIVLTHFVYGSIAADRVTLFGSAKGDPDLPTLNLTVLGENTSVLAYALGTARFRMHGGPRGYQAQGEFQAYGQKTFNFDATILADRKGFVVQAEPIEFAVGENSWRGAGRDLRVVHGDRIELGLLRLASRSQRLELHGVIRLHGEDEFSAQLQDFDLGAVRALLGKRFPLSEGRADAMVEVRGDVARPELTLQGAMRGGKVFDVEGVDALYSVNYANGHLDLDAELDIGDRGTFNAKGQADVDPNQTDVALMVQEGRYDLQLDGERFDLTLVPGTEKKILSGRATGSMHVTGTFDAPELEGKVALADLRLPDVAPLSVTTELTYRGKKVVGTLAVADTAGPVGDAKGSLQIEWAQLREDPHALADALLAGNWKLSGTTAERRLDRLPFTLPAKLALPIVAGTKFNLQKKSGPTEGSVQLVLRPDQKLDFPDCKMQVMPELRVKVNVLHGKAAFSFVGNLDGKKVSYGDGSLDLEIDPLLRGEAVAAPGRIDFKGRLDVADMSHFPWICTQGKGEMHVTWDAQDVLAQKPRATFRVTGAYSPRTNVRAGRRLVSVESCKKDPITFQLDAKATDTGLVASGQTTGCKGGTTNLQASVPILWNEREPIPVHDQARETAIDLDFAGAELRPILDRIPGVLSFSAFANGHLRVTSLKDQVAYTGSVVLQKGKLYPIATGQQIHDITASLTGNGNWLKIGDLSAQAGEGKAVASGGIGFDRWSPKRVQLAMLFDDFPIQREGVDTAWLTGSGALSTDIGEERARTAIKIHSLAVRLPDSNSRSLQPLEPHPDVTLTTELREHPDIPYVLEFFVDGKREISVKRDDFDATIATELAMSYQDPDFRVGGYVEFRRGTFQVFGKEFRLNRGSLHFDGTSQLNPEVNLVATHEAETAGGSPVVAVVTGTLSDPHVEFMSDSCPGDGAVVMLLSGRCPNDDPNSAGSPADAQDAFAAGIVGGILTLGAKREFGNLIPRISFESTGQGQQARVKAGFDAVPKFMRKLVQRVYVQGAVSSGEQGALDFESSDVTKQLDFLIELYFPHNIVGSGKFSPERYWGLDVTWEP